MRADTGVPDLKDVFLKYRNLVHHICFRYVRNSRDAEDLSQEVFIKIHRYLPEFRGDSALTSWIYRIAANCCIDALRARKNASRFDDIDLDSLVAANVSGHENALLAKIDLNRILMQTDARTREILFLALAEGCTHEEVGEVVGMTRWAVTKIVLRFQKKMQAGKKAWFMELFQPKSGSRIKSETPIESPTVAGAMDRREVA
jgi:RNA polymerase sigma-70 factor, ECF subfamily